MIKEYLRDACFLAADTYQDATNLELAPVIIEDPLISMAESFLVDAGNRSGDNRVTFFVR